MQPKVRIGGNKIEWQKFFFFHFSNAFYLVFSNISSPVIIYIEIEVKFISFLHVLSLALLFKLMPPVNRVHFLIWRLCLSIIYFLSCFIIFDFRRKAISSLHLNSKQICELSNRQILVIDFLKKDATWHFFTLSKWK